MRVSAIIPARYASTRFPGKPLADLGGKPMIQWVYERTVQSELIDQVIVATDDQRIFDAVIGFGGEAQMTRPDHSTGTDRLAEVAGRVECDLVVNVQGDEPLIEAGMINAAIKPLLADSNIPMGTLKTPLASATEFLNPNVVKVVTDQLGYALYFSRSGIPFPRDFAERLETEFERLAASKHVGLYVYRRDFLLQYPHLPSTPLERLEKLEQLRALEHGYRIFVADTKKTTQGVDIPEDLEQVRALIT